MRLATASMSPAVRPHIYSNMDESTHRMMKACRSTGGARDDDDAQDGGKRWDDSGRNMNSYLRFKLWKKFTVHMISWRFDTKKKRKQLLESLSRWQCSQPLNQQ
uniref:Uncharacterized protein LOC101509341 isoform X2 n=1 Tax=Cicer arietinum TaxID=3827 RepID=A0A1S3EF09_CICAR|nr:uncharacterized protein LOC101509341 isoform X2 [Cicer arietinum]XP_027192923.1 uncharacterized protein LOC101509341 isoform X2 [Cicer arietinum]